MSLAEQQWFPTSVQVTVHQARDLRTKGKNGTNDAYAIIQVAKDKFSTSVAEKSEAPVWKEEASFDLPLFHPGNAERCTLYVIVMHRAQMGLDKFLGQAVVNLLDLHDNKTRKKTDWFKLVDKTGKEDKARGEVLLDVQFMRNNMSASMFDLSMQDKPRSRMSKLKDKVRGKKKDGFSDSASAIVPSVSQVLTDSEGEPDAHSLNQFPGVKKKSKLKTLFAPKSNLQRNISQSMSTLGALPEKNSPLSGSRSSGLNADSPEVKKKFKFLGHKRTGSSDSRVSQGPFSLLGRSKQSSSDLNSLCINGSHVYTEDSEPKSGSTLSLCSSGHESVEDKHTSEMGDFCRSGPVPSIQMEQQAEERRQVEVKRIQEEEKYKAEVKRIQEEEKYKAEVKRIQEEEKYKAEVKKIQEEEKYKAEVKKIQEEEKYKAEVKKIQEEEQRRYQEEQERRRRFLEDEARRKKQREEEEEEEEERRRKQEEEEEGRMKEAAENQKLEEQKRQEEASMSDRLSSLFGMIRKKEEKKEEQNSINTKEELPASSHSKSGDPEAAQLSTNPFEEVSLSSDPPFGGSEAQQKSSRNSQSAAVFLSRTAKVSAVKPRWAQSLQSECVDSQSPKQLCSSEFTLSSVPSEAFSTLHSSVAPPGRSQISQNSPEASCGSLEDPPSVGSSPKMADKKRRAPPPPSNPAHGLQTGGNTGVNHIPVREIRNPAYVEADGSQQGSKMALPLPDYETLFPQRRHGVQGLSRWDHIIAEVNQKHRDSPTELQGSEMSVDGPEDHKDHRDHKPIRRSPLPQDSPPTKPQPTHKPRPVSSKQAAPAPPKPGAPTPPKPGPETRISQQPPSRSIPGTQSEKSLSVVSAEGGRKISRSFPAGSNAKNSQMETLSPYGHIKEKTSVEREAPTAKPRRIGSKEPNEQQDSTEISERKNSSTQEEFLPLRSSEDRGIKTTEGFAEFDPFPNADLLSRDPWTQPKFNQQQKFEDRGMTIDDLNAIFNEDKPADSFPTVNGSILSKRNEEEESKQAGPAFQRRNEILPSGKNTPKSHPDSTYKEEINSANGGLLLEPEADVKPQSSFYGGGGAFEAGSCSVASSEPLQVVVEEAAPPAGGLSGGKPPLRAWVSPSEAQNNNGGGLSLPPRRPHPVKPLSSVESQHPISSPAVKEIKVRGSSSGRVQVSDPACGGPYTELTQEELITLVVRQQSDLGRKDAKISELEEYIDRLLVRVIEERPNILHSLSAKPL